MTAPRIPFATQRDVVRQFTPNWFAVTMGTGVLALALAQTPLRTLGQILWLVNIALFCLFSGLYAARWTLFPHEARKIFEHPVMSMFFGCAPMGLATIVNGFLTFGPELIGPSAIAIAETLWRIDVLLAIACGLAVPLMMFTRQEHGIERMTAVWLLPIVPAEVAAASGGLLIPHLADPTARLDVLVTSYVLWALSVPLALSILTVLVLRMALHKLPEAGMAATSWLALGPIGTGALALLLLGDAAPNVLGQADLTALAGVFRGTSLLGGLLLWGYGLWWLMMAALITMRQLRIGLPFNLGWWGYTFPLGVFTLATLKLARLLPIPALGALGQSLIAVLAAVWVIVAVRTVRGAWSGVLFHAPCLVAEQAPVPARA
ncbi:TDT family transporter [Caulobacter segnis]|uniref:C4-dicarboxylate ABC transporter n=1 Tax=Caulobacter segnis TaxID=88688 RepID=A0A2W5V2S2_9CAUL|nr:TDT family transporter [Caulobacter segnis]PZR33027.1 MAG: C4-dicarboxylate ABC transporter [Caulobacter segnis]